MSRFNGITFTSDNQFAIAFDWQGSINVGLAHNLTRLRLNNINPSAPVALMQFAGSVAAAGYGWRLTAIDSENNFDEDVSMTWRFPTDRNPTNNWLNNPIPNSFMPAGITNIAAANAFRARTYALQWRAGGIPGFIVVNQGMVTAETPVPGNAVSGNAFQPTVNNGALTATAPAPTAAITGAGVDIVVNRGTATAATLPPTGTYIEPARGRVTAASRRPQTRPRGRWVYVRNQGRVTAATPVPTAPISGSRRDVPRVTSVREAFLIEEDNVMKTVTGVDVRDQSIEITLDQPVAFGSQVRLEYVDPTMFSLRDRGGNKLESFPERVVENEVLNPVDTSPPRVESAETSEDGQTIILRLNEPVEVTDN